MGTRSLLAVEKSEGVLHSQYMQFDGYPTCKGRDFFERIAASFGECREYFCDGNRKPNGNFVQRVVDFLNDYQYQSGHSIGSHQECKLADWLKADSWQEWQYLWRLNGDFVTFHRGEEKALVIPFEIVAALGRDCRLLKFGETDTLLSKFWSGVEEYLGFNPEYAAVGEKPPVAPRLTVLTGECFAFPEQKAGGWRSYVEVKLGGRKIYSSILSNAGQKRSQMVFKAKFVPAKAFK